MKRWRGAVTGVGRSAHESSSRMHCHTWRCAVAGVAGAGARVRVVHICVSCCGVWRASAVARISSAEAMV